VAQSPHTAPIIAETRTLRWRLTLWPLATNVVRAGALTDAEGETPRKSSDHQFAGTFRHKTRSPGIDNSGPEHRRSAGVLRETSGTPAVFGRDRALTLIG